MLATDASRANPSSASDEEDDRFGGREATGYTASVSRTA
jgi:hypothetical protein